MNKTVKLIGLVIMLTPLTLLYAGEKGGEPTSGQATQKTEAVTAGTQAAQNDFAVAKAVIGQYKTKLSTLATTIKTIVEKQNQQSGLQLQKAEELASSAVDTLRTDLNNLSGELVDLVNETAEKVKDIGTALKATGDEAKTLTELFKFEGAEWQRAQEMASARKAAAGKKLTSSAGMRRL